MIYMFLSNNPSPGDINSSNLSSFIWPYQETTKVAASKERINTTLLITGFKLGGP